MVLFIVALAALAAPQVATPAEVFRFTDAFAIAGFTSTDAGGCVRTDVLLAAGNDVDQEPPGAPIRTSGASLRIRRFDSCTGTSLFCSGNVSGVDYRSNPSVREASLTATIPVRCGTTIVDVFVDVTWVATRDPERDVDNVHFDFGDLIINAQFRGASSRASATGTVILNGVNLTPTPSRTAEITHEVGHEVRIELP
jgi:hypothetical protein